MKNFLSSRAADEHCDSDPRLGEMQPNRDSVGLEVADEWKLSGLRGLLELRQVLLELKAHAP